jgi:hypothetical protein
VPALEHILAPRSDLASSVRTNLLLLVEYMSVVEYVSVVEYMSVVANMFDQAHKLGMMGRADRAGIVEVDSGVHMAVAAGGCSVQEGIVVEPSASTEEVLLNVVISSSLDHVMPQTLSSCSAMLRTGCCVCLFQYSSD